jgi:uncharacterized protein YkwD
LRHVGITRRVALLALAVFLGLAVSCAVAATASASGFHLTSSEVAVAKLLNQTRVQHGLHPLQVRTSLCRAARAHSGEMVVKGVFSHSSFSGESQAGRVARYGYALKGCVSWCTGEVIGYGTRSAGGPQAIVNAWLHSAAHRALLLDPRWRDVGVGRAFGTFRGRAWASVFTVDVGLRIH